MQESSLPALFDYDPDTIDPEEQACLELGPYYEPRAVRSARRVNLRRERNRWMQRLAMATVAWLVLYFPFFLAWVMTGHRPLDVILRLLPSSWLWTVFLTHTLLVGGAWGWLWWRAERERRRLREKLQTARTLAQLLQLTPSAFEEWTGELFRRRGYRVINTPDTADHGIDLIVDRGRGTRHCPVQTLPGHRGGAHRA